jgi:hypothetical protein
MPKATHSQHVVACDDRSDLAIFGQQTLACELTFLNRKGLAEDGGRAGAAAFFRGPASAPRNRAPFGGIAVKPR